MPRLRRADCSAPGIHRVGRGKGFSFHEEDGELIEDAETIERISELAIPPAWKNVWICSYPNGHIQATGIDAAGRKQYLYHQHWRESRDREKFVEMLDFAKALPRLRERVEADLSLRGMPRDRALALAVRLLDLGFFRVGSDQYTAENETYGLSTLRRKHLRFEGDAAVFEYPGKGDKRAEQMLEDGPAVKALRSLANRKGGGYELLAFKRGNAWHDVKADDINEYLKEHARGDYSAKDFRTWNATVLAAIGVAEGYEPGLSKTAKRKVVNDTVKRVATYLNNTPAVCRASYIDPRVFDCFDSGETIRPALRRAVGDAGPRRFAERERIERAVVKLLR
jgi:DNA topoisomerase IB